MCAGVINSTQHEACSKSLEAAGLQTGVTDKTRKLEGNAQKYAENQLVWIPNEARFVVATVYTIGIKRQVIIPMNVPYPFQKIELQGYTDKALVLLKWSF